MELKIFYFRRHMNLSGLFLRCDTLFRIGFYSK
jgi:hypothetical protein